MFRKIGSIFLVLLFVAASSAFGQLRIGHMNSQEVLSQMPERESIQQKLNNFIEQKRAELQERTAAFQDSVAEFQQNQANMSEAAIKQKEQQLSQMEASMQKFQQSLRQQIQQRRSALLQPLYEEMNSAIETVAENQDLDFVLNEATSTGENVIYYSSREQLDITQEVLNQVTGTTDQN